MNIVDTSLWIEFFAGAKLDASIMRVMMNRNELFVPVICLYEVRKKFLNDNDPAKADLAMDIMKNGKIISMDFETATLAADFGKQHKLPMADSIIYATAQLHNAEIYTQDRHFEGLGGVRYFAKPFNFLTLVPSLRF